MLRKSEVMKILPIMILCYLVIGETQALVLNNQCSLGQAVNTISTSDVTGNMGGATDCFGVFVGSDPGPGSELSHEGINWAFVSGVDLSGDKQITEGTDIGLFLDVNPGGTSGTWSYDASVFSSSSFLIVLETANASGWAAYLFDGVSASSSSGTWFVAWNNALSYMSVYSITNIPAVFEPDTILLLSISLLLMAGLKGIRSRSVF